MTRKKQLLDYIGEKLMPTDEALEAVIVMLVEMGKAPAADVLGRRLRAKEKSMAPSGGAPAHTAEAFPILLLGIEKGTECPSCNHFSISFLALYDRPTTRYLGAVGECVVCRAVWDCDNEDET